MNEEVDFISIDEHPSFDFRYTSRQENGKILLYQCTKCNYHAPREQLYNFCPVCGGRILRIVNIEYQRSLQIR
jgi:rRNA maturation endonuclease Nob1